MPNRIETAAPFDGDQTWLASTHGTYNARTVKLLKSAFTAKANANGGYLKSGTAIALNGSNEGVPYVQGAADSTAVLVGFLLTDQPYVTAGAGDTHINAPVLDHGRVRTARLPEAWTAPAAAVR